MRASRRGSRRRLRLALSCATLGCLTLGGLAALGAPASAASSVPAPVGRVSYVEGIDISHYQGTIDWKQVASSGKRFAFEKATEGQTYTDPTWSTNRAGAEAAGLKVGAYHFARPDTSANDAVFEADHFASVATWHTGEIPPSLDLEVNGGLSVSALQTWVTSFLQELYVRTGKRGIIYTNPSFWQTSMGDSTWFATNGYKVLWIANWGVPSPGVPASNWGGHGWTFWQWTDCESVPGISGCVDGDRYNGTAAAALGSL